MRGFRPDNLQSKRTTAQAASATIGAGANGVVTITVAAAGAAGNQYSVRAVLAGSADAALAAALNGYVLTVTLGTDGGGLADDTKNTATLVAAAIDAISEFAATASGTGATVIPVTASTALTAGHDVFTVPLLAKAANMPDRLIYNLEQGATCEVYEAQRLADALSVSLSALGSAV